MLLAMPVTSIDVDADLLARAKEATGLRTTKEVVNYALGEVAARSEKRRAFEWLLNAEFLDAFKDAEFRKGART